MSKIEDLNINTKLEISNEILNTDKIADDGITADRIISGVISIGKSELSPIFISDGISIDLSFYNVKIEITNNILKINYEVRDNKMKYNKKETAQDMQDQEQLKKVLDGSIDNAVIYPDKYPLNKKITYRKSRIRTL